jgi:hypothetical protein
VKLRCDPYAVFRLSRTPAGLYARQKWLGEAGSVAWKNDFDARVAALMKNQLPDGSWNRSVRTTVIRLFGLHLTTRQATNAIDDGIDWLLERLADTAPPQRPQRSDKPVFAGLPFVPGDPAAFLLGATLFLATIFGRPADPGIAAHYRRMCRAFFSGASVWGDAPSASNLFRALVVHPVFSRTEEACTAVEQLAALQTENGEWQGPLPFYLTLNALAHLDLPAAERQLQPAFDRLVVTQNADGSWGRSDPEWNTFLAIHALRNKGFL